MADLSALPGAELLRRYDEIHAERISQAPGHRERFLALHGEILMRLERDDLLVKDLAR